MTPLAKLAIARPRFFQLFAGRDRWIGPYLDVTMKLFNRYLQAYINMLGQLVACNRLHSVYERCSRWILMTFDRVGTPAVY